MTVRPLTDPFDRRSALSRRDPWMVGRDEVAAEVAREFERRRAAYPADVARERMTRDEADRHLAAWAAIADDHAPGAAPDAAVRHDWAARVREVRRELALRRNAWPRRLASPTSPLDPATAAARMEALDAVHWRYWDELWRFSPPGEDPADDPARHRHVAERQVARLAPAWRDATDADAARAEHAAWRDLATIAEHVEAGGYVTAVATPAALARIRAVVAAAHHDALWTGPARSDRQAEIAQLGPLLAWLDRLVLWTAPRTRSPERQAA